MKAIYSIFWYISLFGKTFFHNIMKLMYSPKHLIREMQFKKWKLNWESTRLNEIDILRPKLLPKKSIQGIFNVGNVVAFKIMYANVYPT